MDNWEDKLVCPECDDALIDKGQIRCEGCQETYKAGFEEAKAKINKIIESRILQIEERSNRNPTIYDKEKVIAAIGELNRLKEEIAKLSQSNTDGGKKK